MKLHAVFAFFVASLVLLAGLGSTPTPAAAAQLMPLFPMIACCDSIDSPSSCWPTTNPVDLSPCDPAAEIGECQVDPKGYVDSCEPISVICCQTEAGAVWATRCKPHEPGMVCSGAVLASDQEG
jgi:hypothetical protein